MKQGPKKETDSAAHSRGHHQGRWEKDRNVLEPMLSSLTAAYSMKVFPMLQPVLNSVSVCESEDEGYQPYS